MEIYKKNFTSVLGTNLIKFTLKIEQNEAENKIVYEMEKEFLKSIKKSLVRGEYIQKMVSHQQTSISLKILRF